LITLGRKTGTGKLLEKETMITRIGMAFSILLTVFLSLTISGGFIARATSIFFGVMANAFLAPFLLGLYWKRMTKNAAIASMIGGMICSIFGYVLFHAKESALFGLAKLLTGNAALIPGAFGAVDPLVYSLPVSFILAIGVSLFTKNKNPKAVSDLIDKVRPQKAV
jgi:SSS family solute:Na+ symporter